MSLSKGTKEYIKRLSEYISDDFNKIINLGGDNFKNDVKKNIESINDYLLKIFETDMPYKEESIQKFYKNECSIFEAPINELIMVRFEDKNGNFLIPEDKLQNCNVWKFSRPWPYGPLTHITCLNHFTNSYEIYSQRRFIKAPKYFGYSDGILFHFLGEEKFEKDSDLKSLEFFKNCLSAYQIPFIEKDVTLYKDTKRKTKEIGIEYTSICYEIANTPIENINSLVLKWDKNNNEEKEPFIKYIENIVNKSKKEIY